MIENTHQLAPILCINIYAIPPHPDESRHLQTVHGDCLATVEFSYPSDGIIFMSADSKALLPNDLLSLAWIFQCVVKQIHQKHATPGIPF